jgi:hypothetical protein
MESRALGSRGPSRGGWRSSARLHVARGAMAQALIRTTFARGRPVTAANPQRSGIGPHGSRVAFALPIWSASPGPLSSTKVLGSRCGTKKVHFEMKNNVIEGRTTLSKWRTSLSKPKTSLSKRRSPLSKRKRTVSTPSVCRTVRGDFISIAHVNRVARSEGRNVCTREPCRTEKLSYRTENFHLDGTRQPCGTRRGWSRNDTRPYRSTPGG